MKLSKLAVVCCLALSTVVSVAPAHAISAKYRAQLEREHKTQVQEISAAKKTTVTLKQATTDADAAMNCPIGQAADFLIGQGWKANQGDWHKGKYTIRLVVENGIVVNAQVM